MALFLAVLMCFLILNIDAQPGSAQCGADIYSTEWKCTNLEKMVGVPGKYPDRWHESHVWTCCLWYPLQKCPEGSKMYKLGDAGMIDSFVAGTLDQSVEFITYVHSNKIYVYCTQLDRYHSMDWWFQCGLKHICRLQSEHSKKHLGECKGENKDKNIKGNRGEKKKILVESPDKEDEQSIDTVNLSQSNQSTAPYILLAGVISLALCCCCLCIGCIFGVMFGYTMTEKQHAVSNIDVHV